MSAPAVSLLVPQAFATGSDGAPIGDVLARANSLPSLLLITTTQLADAHRIATGASMASRPGLTGYVRDVGSQCCSRCAVLAGRFYRWSSGFKRHERCNCGMVPTTSGGFDDLVDSPYDLFEQGRITDLSKAQAKAIQDGADISQVVNIRGIRIAGGSSPASRIRTTLSGTTRRGTYGRREIDRVGGASTRDAARRQGAVAQYRQTRAARARLTPESIYRLASDRADAIRLLKVYGYIF